MGLARRFEILTAIIVTDVTIDVQSVGKKLENTGLSASLLLA